ncbi:RNA polymerase sigma factor [Marinibactrum halimedae]|nr:RNA polymerase sigma factor [Marinibactrum halimedae]
MDLKTTVDSNVVQPIKTPRPTRDDDLHRVRQIQLGSISAYESLYRDYVGQVYRLCLRLTGEKSLAEDATQEVFIQLWQKIGNFEGQSQFSTWLHRVTSNIAISYLRKQKGWLKRIFNIDDTDVHKQHAPRSVEEIPLEKYIQKLPERARLVFVLHALEGYRHEEVADLLNIAIGTSKAQFHRAKKMLEEWMSHEG